MSDLIPYVLQYGTPLVVLIVSLESLGLPLPGETLMIALGATAGAGEVSVTGLFFAVWAGSVLGDNMGYLIGRRFGRRAILALGRHSGLTEDRLARFEAPFQRYGVLVVLVARFFIILRQLNGIIAGSLEMPWWRFFAANVVGAGLWAGFWLFASSYFSAHIVGLMHNLHDARLVLLAVLVLGLVGAIYYLHRLLQNPRN